MTVSNCDFVSIQIHNCDGKYKLRSLSTKKDASETFGDDAKTSVFGAHARATKVQNLRA